MTRPLAAATATALDGAIVPLAVIAYLDILGDPFYGWSGIGDLTFAAAETGDPALDNKTFGGISNLMQISEISEGAGGSDSLELTFPGVDMNDQLAKQIITVKNRWQFRRAIVWLVLLDPVTAAIVGKPFRIKTGRMDAIPYSESGDKAELRVSVEGQQAYGSEPLNTRYSEQINLDNTDTSQQYVYNLSNMSANIGTKTAGLLGGPRAGAFMGSGFFGSLFGRMFNSTSMS